MNANFLQRSRLSPWAGVLIPPAAWALHHQLGSDLIFYDCRLGGSALIALLGLGMAVVTAGAGLLSWVSRDRSERSGVRTFAAMLGALTAGLFLLALAFQTEAALLLPACHR